MTTVLYAQPCDLAAGGFYFQDAETYAAKSNALRNDYGEPVEEFEIQFIDGEAIDAALVRAVGLHQGDVAAFFEKIEEWDDTEKQIIIIAAGACGYVFDWQCTAPPAPIDKALPGNLGLGVSLHRLIRHRATPVQTLREGSTPEGPRPPGGLVHESLTGQSRTRPLLSTTL